MASLLGRILSRIYGKKIPFSIMIVGLDNSGKTSILNYLATDALSAKTPDSKASATTSQTPKTTGTKTTDSLTWTQSPPESSTNEWMSSETSVSNKGLVSANIIPTVGYNYERIQYKSLAITALDFSGQNRYRNLWQEFYNGVDAIVFVIDSSDLIRLVVARDELETMLSHPYFNTLRAPCEEKGMAQELAGQMPMMEGHQAITTSERDLVQKQLFVSNGKLVQTPLRPAQPVAGPGRPTVSRNKVQRDALLHPTAASSARRTLRNKMPLLFLANKSDLPNSVDTEVIKKALNLNSIPVDRHPWLIVATSVNLHQGIVEGFDWLAGQLLSA